MKRTKIVDIFDPQLIGQQVSVKGWVRSRRGNKHVQFVALNDGSTIKNIQIVFDMEMYRDSRQMRAVQYVMEQNVIRFWNDEILTYPV